MKIGCFNNELFDVDWKYYLVSWLGGTKLNFLDFIYLKSFNFSNDTSIGILLARDGSLFF